MGPIVLNVLRFLKILELSGHLDLNKILVRSYKTQAYSWTELSKIAIRFAPASAQILIRDSDQCADTSEKSLKIEPFSVYRVFCTRKFFLKKR